MEELMNKLYEGLQLIYGIIDWMFMILFLFVAWLAITIFKTKRITDKMNLSMRNRWIVLITVAVLSVFWWWVQEIRTKEQILSMFVTVVAAMVFNELIGINTIFTFVYNKIQKFFQKFK